MLFSEIDGNCSLCPLMNEGICPGGWTGGPNGPIEPPCCGFDEDTDLDAWVADYYDYQRRREEEENRLLKEQQEKQRKKDLARKRQVIMMHYTSAERHEVDRLKKAIKSMKEAQSFAESMAFAVNMTNSMLGYSERVKTNSETDEKIKKLEAALEKAQEALKAKQKECRATDRYKNVS